VNEQGIELPKDEQGKYIGTGIQKIETTTTNSVDDPLTDDQGNTVSAGTADALLRRVKEHFDREEYENVEITKVEVLEVKTVRAVSGEELSKL
jgi:hypothetical protein